MTLCDFLHLSEIGEHFIHVPSCFFFWDHWMIGPKESHRRSPNAKARILPLSPLSQIFLVLA